MQEILVIKRDRTQRTIEYSGPNEKPSIPADRHAVSAALAGGWQLLVHGAPSASYETWTFTREAEVKAEATKRGPGRPKGS
jgi:hypothetical protein